MSDRVVLAYSGELVAGVHDDGLDSAAIQRALAHGLQVLAALSQVEGDSDDLAAGHFSQIRDGHGGVQAARIRENNAVGHDSQCSLIQQCEISGLKIQLSSVGFPANPHRWARFAPRP